MPGAFREKEIAKGHKETLLGDKYVHYFDFDDSLTAVSILQNALNCTF